MKCNSERGCEEELSEMVIEILGHKVKLKDIKNPHIRRAIIARSHEFLFNYGDHKDHTEEERKVHCEYLDYSATHTETHYTETQKWKKYSEYSEARRWPYDDDT